MKKTWLSRDINIFGFELIGIILSELSFRFIERNIRRESRRWTKLVRDIRYILFYFGLRNAIMPGTDGNKLY